MLRRRSGGNAEFLHKFPSAQSYAGSTTAPPHASFTVLKHGSTFQLGSLAVRAVHTPCHTQDHICFYVEDKANDQRAVFTGDTLFVSGCGRFFEGTAEEMDEALNGRLAKLPLDTVVYVGHEYTKSNVAFSRRIDPDNARIQALAKFADENAVTTGRSTIKDELDWNVFMRLDSEAVRGEHSFWCRVRSPSVAGIRRCGLRMRRVHRELTERTPPLGFRSLQRPPRRRPTSRR